MDARERSPRIRAASRVAGAAGEAASLGTMQIFVLNSFSGNQFELRVMPDATIHFVKCKIFDKEGILPNQQSLIFGTMPLQTGCSLTDYNIIEGSTIDLVCTSSKAAVLAVVLAKIFDEAPQLGDALDNARGPCLKFQGKHALGRRCNKGVKCPFLHVTRSCRFGYIPCC